MTSKFRPVILLILDGWGIGKNDQSNPLAEARPKTLTFIKDNYKSGSLQAAGIAVGLPWGEESNSEVGHLILGAGKVIYQHFLRIWNTIKDGSFFKNKALLEAAEHVKNTGGTLHFAGLLTEGIVHASLDHLKALIEFAKQNQVPYKLHLFADGKDSAPKSLLSLLERLGEAPTSLSGRYFALDRDNHWDRTEKAYRAIMGEAIVDATPEEAVHRSYDKGVGDEFFEPVSFGTQPEPIKEGDALLFFDFREDSIRQIAECFILDTFDRFPVQKFKNLHIVTMTEYSSLFKVPVVFPPEEITHPLARVVADSKKAQLHIAETEKYAHVTYFFNGLHEGAFPGETHLLIQSQKVAHHNEAPEMRASEITDAIVTALEERKDECIIANFANLDIVAHTGDYAAALRAIEVVDNSLARILEALQKHDGVLVITSDHGNVEVMLDTQTWLPETKHDANPVPVHVVGRGFESLKPNKTLENVGLLSDVAPTVLALMGIQQPKEMSGQNLLPFLE